MPKVADHSRLIGVRIGKVVVTSFSHTVPSTKSKLIYHYTYVCDCGYEGTSSGCHLKSAMKKRGAYYCKDCKAALARVTGASNRTYHDPTDLRFAQAYNIYRGNAKRRGFDMNLSSEQFREIVTKNCHYCGFPPGDSRYDCNIGIIRGLCNGIDRVDSTLGYSLDNCVPCCEDCNKAKQAMSYDKFLALVSRIYNHRVVNVLEHV